MVCIIVWANAQYFHINNCFYIQKRKLCFLCFNDGDGFLLLVLILILFVLSIFVLNLHFILFVIFISSTCFGSLYISKHIEWFMYLLNCIKKYAFLAKLWKLVLTMLSIGQQKSWMLSIPISFHSVFQWDENSCII